MKRRNALGSLGALTLPVLGWPITAGAAGYPERPIKFISPSPPGGMTDFVPRVIGKEMSDMLGQPVVIENRAGANQTMATNFVAKAPPDGYTILLATSGALAVNPHLMAKIPYDALREFTPITMIGGVASVIMTTQSSSTRTFQEFLAAGRSKGPKPAFGFPGVGSSPHMVLAALKDRTDAEFLLVPYKGTAELFSDAKGGQFEYLIHNIGPSLPLIRSGELRPLAVTSIKRSPHLPDVPAIAEVLPGFEVLGWMAVCVPAGTPGEVVEKLAMTLHAALGKESVRKSLETYAVVAMPTGPKEAKHFIEQEYRRWGDVVRRYGMKAE